MGLFALDEFQVTIFILFHAFMGLSGASGTPPWVFELHAPALAVFFGGLAVNARQYELSNQMCR